MCISNKYELFISIIHNAKLSNLVSIFQFQCNDRKCETDFPVTSWLPCPPLLNIPDCTSNTLNGQLGRLPLACFPDIGPFANIMPVSNVMKMPSYHRQNVSICLIFLHHKFPN